MASFLFEAERMLGVGELTEREMCSTGKQICES